MVVGGLKSKRHNNNHVQSATFNRILVDDHRKLDSLVAWLRTFPQFELDDETEDVSDPIQLLGMLSIAE